MTVNRVEELNYFSPRLDYFSIIFLVLYLRSNILPIFFVFHLWDLSLDWSVDANEMRSVANLVHPLGQSIVKQIKDERKCPRWCHDGITLVCLFSRPGKSRRQEEKCPMTISSCVTVVVSGEHLKLSMVSRLVFACRNSARRIGSDQSRQLHRNWIFVQVDVVITARKMINGHTVRVVGIISK